MYCAILWIDAEMPMDSSILNLFKINEKKDVHDYLSQIYIDHKNTGNSGKFKDFCENLDDILESQQFYIDDDITKDNIYNWMIDYMHYSYPTPIIIQLFDEIE